MRSLLVRKKKFFFIGGIVALLIVAGAVLVNKLQPQEASATGTANVDLVINGSSGISYFSMDERYAWCITPDYVNPDPGPHTATVYSLSDFQNATSGQMLYIKRMFTAYYWASLNVDGSIDGNAKHSITNNDGMHWALAYLYQGYNEYPQDGQNAQAIFNFYKKGMPSDLETATVTIIPDAYRSDGKYAQAIFTADYTVKTSYTQKLEAKKVWRDNLDSHNNVNIQFKVYDTTTNSYITEDGSDVFVLNEGNEWHKTFAFEREANEGPHSFSIEEIITDGSNGFHTGEDADGTYWYHDELSGVYYVMPSSTTETCDESDPYKVTCTMYNSSRNLTTVNFWPIKHWNDSGYKDEYRPESVKFIVHAFVEKSSGVYEEVSGLPHTGTELTMKNWYGPEDTDDWGGFYWRGFETKAEVDHVTYSPVVYAIEEVASTAPSTYAISCETDFVYDGHTYCLASQKDGSGDYEVEWTNTIDKISVTAKKHWNDGGDASNRPSTVAFNIFRSVNGGTREYYRRAYMRKVWYGSNINDWTLTLSLVKKDKDGNDYNYTYQEVDYYDRDTETYNSDKYILDGDVLGFDISDTTGMVNTARIDIPVKKCWVDKDDSKRPGSLIFNLYEGTSSIVKKTLTLTKSNADNDGCWTGEFTKLAAFDDDGNALTYRVEEVASESVVRNYETATDCIVDVEARKTNNNGDMSCDFVNYQLIDIPVQKCWVDKGEADRPGKLTFNLYSYTQGQGLSRLPIRSLELTAANLDTDGCWSGVFENLPAYDKSTNDTYTYTVKEDLTDIDNYTPEEDGGDSCVVDIAGRYTRNQGLTCSFTNVELVDIPVKKVWAEDKKEDRPGSIEVSLLCGETILDTVTLSEENNLDGDNTWEYTWENRRIDECEQGYSVAENINVPGYATKITGNAEDGFVITNTKTLDEILTWGSLGAGSFGAIAAGFFIVKRKLFDR